MKKFLTLIFLIFTCSGLSAQQTGTDAIVSRDGSRTEAIVLEINSSEVVYQTRAGGPYFVLSIDDVSEVIFSSGFRQDLRGQKIVPFNRTVDGCFPGAMSASLGRLFLDRQVISEDMVRKVLASDGYWHVYRESSRKWKAGKALTYSGLGCIAAAGAVCAMDIRRGVGEEITIGGKTVTVSEWTTEFAAGLGAAGILMTGSGLILKSIGKSRMNSLARWYNAAHGKYPEARSAGTQLAFTLTPSGATLAISF